MKIENKLNLISIILVVVTVSLVFNLSLVKSANDDYSLAPTLGIPGGSNDTQPPTSLSIVINDGQEITTQKNINLTLGATGAVGMMISNKSDFIGAEFEKFIKLKSWELSKGDGVKKVYVKFNDPAGNVSDAIFTKIFLQDSDSDSDVLGDKYIDEKELQLVKIYEDASYIWLGEVSVLLNYIDIQRDLVLETKTADKYLVMLIPDIRLANVGNLEQYNINAMTNFITYGTKTTSSLGIGERAGVLNSYKIAFNKLPKTETDWQDVIKIANGRWPSEKSLTAEIQAQELFTQIYLRSAQMTNSNDNAAVTVIAYGLRPDNRNLESEKIAINTFKAIKGVYPFNGTDWDIVRAIAYSGASR